LEIEKYLTQKELDSIVSELKTPEEVDLFLRSLEEMFIEGTSRVKEELDGVDWVERPVDMETFLRDPYYLGILDSLYPRLVDDLLELFDPGNEYYLVLLSGSIGWGKCLAGDSLVWTDKGPVPINRIVRDGLGVEVYGVDDGYRLVRARCVGSVSSGVKPVYRLRLASGCEIKATDEHPVLTGDGWKRLKDLISGDLVATARRLPLSSRKVKEREIIDNLIKFLAYMTADGATGEYQSGKSKSLSCRFTKGKEEILEDFREVCLALGSSKISCVEKRGKVEVLEPNGMRDVLREHGLAGNRSKTKRIPASVWRYGDEGVALFLNRLFWCDGNVNNGNPPKIEYDTSSERLADDIIMALKVLGIHGRKYGRVVRNQYEGREFKAWRVYISGVTELGKFFDKVGWGIDGKDNKFRDNIKKVKPNSNVDVIPIDYERLKELRKAVGGMSKFLWNRIRFPKGQLMGRMKWNQVLPLLGGRVPKEFLRLGSEDVFWDRVKSVEFVGEEEVFDLDIPATRNFIANGVIVHNSTLAEVAMARIIYEVSCYRNPQKVYGMMESDKMFFANISVTHSQAKRVVFEGLKGKIKNSEYFRKVFPYEEFAAELRFPNNILVAAATQTQVLGMNTFAAIMDEANFMTVTEGGPSMKFKGKRVYDQAEVVFQALYRRMETRFMKRGMLPGKLIAISSAQYPEDFMERKIEMYKDNPHAFIRQYAVWETVPRSRYLGPTFSVLFNRETGMGRIAEEGERPTDEEEEIAGIPIEYRHDFEVDMEGSLRDLGGRATAAIEPFIMRRDKIYAMCDPERRHPYSLYETTLRDGGYILKDILCEWYEDRDEKGNIVRSGWRPKVNPKAKRVVHIDPSLSMDAAGLIMGHVSHWEERQRVRVVQVIDPVSGEKKLTREVYSETVPVIWIDLILRIVPPPNGEIILNDVRELIYELRSLGFQIGVITMDSFQSRDTMQMLAAKGFRVEELSVDTNIEPYNRMRMAMYEDRILAYTHDVLIKELKGLERNKKKGKVDHPKHSSKDLADALAGVVYNCETKIFGEPVAPSLGIVESPFDEEVERRKKEVEWLLDRRKE